MIKLMIDSDKRLWIFDKDGAARSVLDDYLLMFGENDFEEIELRCPVNVHGNIISHMNVELVAVSDEEYSYPVHFENQDGTLVSDTILIDRNMTSIAGELPVYVRFSMGEYLGKTNSVVFRIRSNVCEECRTPQSLTVTPQPYPQEFSSPAGYDRVEVGAVDSEELTVTPIDAKQIFTPTLGKYYRKVTVNRPEVLLQDVDVIPSSQAQVITADEEHYALRSVRVEPIASALDLEVKRAAPSVSAQTITPDGEYVGLSEVRVDPVTAQIDSNIVPQNIRKDVTVLGVTGAMENLTEIVPDGAPEVPKAMFYDYDGTLVGSYTLAEAEALSAPPAPPAHQGLTFLRYNRSLESVIAYLRDEGQSSCASALYATSNGHTRLYIHIDEKPDDIREIEMKLGIFSSDMTIRWGDGDADQFSEDGYTTVSHTYPASGDYTIDIEINGGLCELGYRVNNNRYPLLSDNQGMLRAVEMGTGCNVRGYGFQDCYRLRTAVLPDQAISIGENTFQRCTSLMFVSIPDRLTDLPAGAFSYCSGLGAMIYPDSVTALHAELIGCQALDRVFIPSTITYIPDNNMYMCYGLRYVSLPSSVTSIGEFAFAQCSALKNIKLSEGLLTLRNSAFSACCSLEKIHFPSTLTAIGDNAFSSCCSLSDVVFPQSLRSIGSEAFSECNSLTQIDFRDITIGRAVAANCVSLKKVRLKSAMSDSCFYGCRSLTELDLSDDYTTIPPQALNNCKSLLSYTAPATLTTVSLFMFSDNTNMLTIDFTALSAPPSVLNDANVGYLPGNARVYVRDEAVRQLFLADQHYSSYHNKIVVA